MRHKKLSGPFLVDNKGKLVFDMGYISDEELNLLITIFEQEREIRIGKKLGKLKQMPMYKLKDAKISRFEFKSSGS